MIDENGCETSLPLRIQIEHSFPLLQQPPTSTAIMMAPTALTPP